MNQLDPNILIEISSKISGIDERTKAFEKAADHRHANVMQGMQNLVPRKEYESGIADTRGYAETLAAQTRMHCDTNREAVLVQVKTVSEGLTEIRDGQRFVRRTAIGAAITGAVGLLFGLIKWVAPIVWASQHVPN